MTIEPGSRTAHFSLWDTISIIIGIVIGTGLFETPPLIYQIVSSAWLGMFAWGLGGVVALIGALCYAELASTYPHAGGEYYYLTRAFGSWMGLLFAWSQLTIVRTGNIGLMAYVFADYAVRLWDFGNYSGIIYALASVAVLTVLNLLGVVFGKRTQNLLSTCKIIGILGIVVVGFFFGNSHPASTAVASTATEPSFGLAMVFVLFTYGGWNDASFVAAEQKNKKRNIPLALILGTLLITAIYLLVNAAYLWVLGFDGVRQSKAIAADVLDAGLGQWGSKAICILVMVSALSAINGMILTGSRIYATLGQDFPIFKALGGWDERLGTPIWSLIVQCVMVEAMILGVSTPFGQGLMNKVLAAVRLPEVAWTGHGGFDALMRCTAPAFWLFLLLVGLAFFVLRVKDQEIERPYITPLFPWLPIIFCDACAYMLYSSTAYAGTLTIFAVVISHVGLLFYHFSRKPSA